MTKAKVLTSTNITSTPNIDEITQKLAVDCELISMAINPMFCIYLGITTNGEIVCVHRNAEVFVKELFLTLCDVLEEEGISPKDREIIEKIRKTLLFEKEHSSNNTQTETD